MAAPADSQPNFGQWFGRDTPLPINYRLRNEPNFEHDLAYISSYIHDARLYRQRMSLKNGELLIPINRDAWELGYTERGDGIELHIADSLLRMSEVVRVTWRFSAVDLIEASELWISKFHASDRHYRVGARRGYLMLTGENWRLAIEFKHEWEMQVSLEDQETPYLPLDRLDRA